MRENGIIIAIDGPAGVGKSSVGKNVAARINYKFISTGKMYRALAFKAARKGLDIGDEDFMLKTAEASAWEFRYSSGVEPLLHLDGIPLDRELSDENVGKASSAVSRLLKVRNFMVSKQREIGAAGGFIMEGRDIGTNVFPDAELKIYLDASPEARALRRVRQLEADGRKSDYALILEMIKKRDHQDSLREHNPLKKAEDGIYIDSTGLTQEEVCGRIFNLYEGVLKVK